MRTFTDEDGFLWEYDCGWRIIADNGKPSMGHPYRAILGASMTDAKKMHALKLKIQQLEKTQK